MVHWRGFLKLDVSFHAAVRLFAEKYRAGIDFASAVQVIDGYRYAGRSDCCFASSRTPRASKPCDRWNDWNGPLRCIWCGLTHRTADALGTTLPGLAGRAVRRAGGMEKGGCLAEEASAQAAAHAQSGDPAIATLGGFLDRKGDGEPGVKTLRLGYSASPTSASGCGMPESGGGLSRGQADGQGDEAPSPAPQDRIVSLQRHYYGAAFPADPSHGDRQIFPLPSNQSPHLSS